jgi:putative transposase
MRKRFDLCVYGYVVMPEHVHLVLSEPERGTLADALLLKLAFSKRLPRGSGQFSGPFWQKR